MLLGFIVSERGIEANPEKISAITRMGLIQNIKGVQRVTGCLAALLYIAATTQVISAALVVEREEEGHALKSAVSHILQ